MPDYDYWLFRSFKLAFATIGCFDVIRRRNFLYPNNFACAAKSIAIIIAFFSLSIGREKTKAREHRDLYAANIVRSPIQSHQIHAGRHLEAGIYHSHQQFRWQREDTALGERYKKSGMQGERDSSMNYVFCFGRCRFSWRRFPHP